MINTRLSSKEFKVNISQQNLKTKFCNLLKTQRLKPRPYLHQPSLPEFSQYIRFTEVLIQNKKK